MTSHPRRTTLRMDGDGLRRLETRGVRIVFQVFAAVVGLVSLAVVVAVLVIRFAPRDRPRSVAPPDAIARGAPPPAAAPSPRASATAAPPERAAGTLVPRRKRAPDGTEPKPAESKSAEPKSPDEEVTFTVPAPGERTGIAVFPPPGTKPIKRGIVVPENVELPPGYVRHHQTTDDGQQLPAVLMFHPDYEFVDERGVPVRLPEDRIVPPEMAPPGLPIQILEVPDSQAPPGAPR